MKVKLGGTVAVVLGLVMFVSAGTDEAKKLVGVWEITSQAGKPIAENERGTMEFMADGKFTIKRKTKVGRPLDTGTYTVQKDSITLKFKLEDDKDAINVAKINKLTETELDLEWTIPLPDGKSKSLGVMEHKRVKK